MKPAKSTINEARFLELLQRVLPKATPDAHLATSIYDQVAKEVKLLNLVASFEKFCSKGSLPNLEPETVGELQAQLEEHFGAENVAIAPDEEGKSLAVEITLPDRSISSKVKVIPPGSEEEEGAKGPFVPFPVCLPEDPHLVWTLGRREDFAAEEAARSLAKIEEEFWATKAGQKMLRKGAERCFADFIAHVPAAALSESGMKRHYKLSEPLKTLRLLPPAAAPQPSE